METKYKKAIIYVTDNGYSIQFGEYKGNTPMEQGWMIAKTTEEIKKILDEHFIELIK